MEYREQRFDLIIAKLATISMIGIAMRGIFAQGPGGKPGLNGQPGQRGPKGKQGAPGEDGHPGEDVSYFNDLLTMHGYTHIAII